MKRAEEIEVEVEMTVPALKVSQCSSGTALKGLESGVGTGGNALVLPYPCIVESM